MKILKALLVFAFVFTLTNLTMAATGGWLNPSKSGSLIKKLKRTGMIPVSVACRNSPKAKVQFRHEMKIVWQKNTGKRDWVLQMYRGQLDFTPNNLHKKERVWRRVYRKNIRSGSSTYRCSLWYKK